MLESSKTTQIRTYLHEMPQKTKTNTPTPSCARSNKAQTYPNSHPLVDLLAAGDANSDRFGLELPEHDPERRSYTIYN